MAIGPEALRALLVAHVGPKAGALRLSPAPSERHEGREQRFMAQGADGSLDIHVYPSSEREVARREEAGLRLGGAVGLAPALVAAGAVGAEVERAAGLEPGAWVIIAQQPRGEPLGQRPLSDPEADGWLFLLLTLHHLRPEMTSQSSSMSADLSAWWARIQPGWEAGRAQYGAPPYAPLMRALGQLHAITQVRIETNRALWAEVTRRPCHGNPAPGRLVKEDTRLTLTKWSGFGLGDPAIEVARVAALAALAGELTRAQYAHFVAAYLDGMRDLRDATLEQRLRIFASVAPMGFTLTALAALAQPATPPAMRRSLIEQISRALAWSQESLGVEIDAPAALLAPLLG